MQEDTVINKHQQKKVSGALTEQISITMVAIIGTTMVLLIFTCVLVSFTSRVDASSSARFIGYSMISPLGRRRYRSRSRRRYRDERRPSHPTTIAMYDYSKHFLDDENWMTDKKIRIWDPRYNSRKRANDRTMSGRLILTNILCYGIQAFNPKFTQWGVKLSERILTGKDLYRLISPVFLHGGLYHLFTNMYSLNNIGPITEQVFGPGRFFVTYLVAGASGNLLSAIKSPYPALGASGAVFGVMASLYVFLARNDWVMGEQGESYSNAITQTLLINLVMGVVNPMVDNWGHIGGALGGAVMAWYFGPRLYIAELPIPDVGNQPLIVDKPIVRIPSSVESIPTKIGEGLKRLTRRMKVWGYVVDLPDKPWAKNRKGGHNIDYKRRQEMAPNKSIKPRLPQ